MKLTVAALSLAIALVVAEWCVRASPAMDRLGWTRVPTVEERLARVSTRAADELRVLGIGDSFADFRDTDGANFLRVLEREAVAHDRPVALDNLGEEGAGLVRYLENLDRYAERVVPNIAIIAVYLGNDLLDYEIERRRAERGIEGRRSGSGGGSAATSGWRHVMRRHSVLANALFRAAKGAVPSLRTGTYRLNLQRAAALFDLDAEDLRAAESRITADMIERAEADAINTWDLAFGVVRPQLYTEMLNLDGGFAEAFEAFAADLVRIGNACDRRGITPVFVSIPPSVQVATHYHDYFQRLGHTLGADLVGNVPLSGAVTALLAEHDWPHLDLTTALASSEDHLYIPDDTDWNVHGQRVAGLALFEFLEREDWFRPSEEGTRPGT